jgi:hypothetical protein
MARQLLPPTGKHWATFIQLLIHTFEHMIKREERQDQFGSWAHALVAHPTKAQILLELQGNGQTLELALAVLKRMGIGGVEVRVLQKGDPGLVLLYLQTGDMREAIYALMEAGFIRLKGINHQMGREPESAK